MFSNGAGRKLVLAVLLVPVVAAAIAASGELGFSRSVTPGLIARLERQFGQGARARLEGWRAFVVGAPKTGGTAGGGDPLQPVNLFFNRLPEMTDLAHWGVEDYWATPAESLASNGADCEDFAIAKYFTLKELGVPIARLRLIYVKTARSGSAHMVLAYYPVPQGDPLILDNLERNIRTASQRPDLIPVYSFNDEDLLSPAEGAPAPRAGATANRKWREVLEKLERELTY